MTHFPHTLIRASAGTGKTFQLSNRYLGLLRDEVKPDEILATTFTRKAAGEILDRVMIRLAEATTDDAQRQQLAGFLKVTSLSRSQCLELLRQLIRHLHRLRISTLDAFFAQLAGSFCLELGIPPGWRIIEELHDSYLRDEAIELTLQGDSHREVERLVHLMAKGEARRSISDLIRSTVDDLYDLYMETDAKAWQRIPKPRSLSDDALAAAIEQLQSVPLPNDKRFEAARCKDVDAAQRTDWAQFIGRGLAAKILAGETLYYNKEIPSEAVAGYQALLDHARAVLLREVARQTEATYELLDTFHAIYGRLKRQTRSLRFEDITRALARSDDLDNIDRHQFRLDTSIAHLLLDEFQDTSLAQWHVIRPFAGRITSASRRDRAGSFFCVGDVKQAIYGWRGGSSEILNALETELSDLEPESLNTSYRSAQPIIDTVNDVFARMTQHPHLEKYEAAVTEWSTRFEEHTTERKTLSGYAQLCTAPQAGDDENPDDVKLRYAAKRIKQLVEQAPGCSVGVLARRNSVVGQLIYELRNEGVPASEEGGNPLTDSPAVQSILSLLAMADHPGDTIARYHVAHSPLGPHIDYTNHTDCTRTLQIADDVRAKLLYDGYGMSILRWSELLRASCNRRDWSRLQQFVELAFGYEPMATLRTSDFLRYVERERVADPTTAEVRVMTVHQSKGLQFDIVVLADLDAKLLGQADTYVVGQPSVTESIDCVCLYRNADIQKLLPPKMQKLFEETTRKNVNEALCVLYVALTRAIHALHMIVRPSSKSEKKLPKTSAGLLRAALSDGCKLAAEEIAFETGDPNWHQSLEPRTPVSAVEPESEPSPEIKLAAAIESSTPEHTAPSQLEGGGRVSIARILDLRSSVATSRGTLIHALFERVRWLDDGPPDPDQLRRVALRFGRAGLNIDQQLDAFSQMLAMPEIADVLCRAFYRPPYDSDLQQLLSGEPADRTLLAEVHNERRFAVRDEERILSGIIDRLVLLYDNDRLVAADIIDYKTDALSGEASGAVGDLVEHYRPQLDAYRRAVASMYQLPKERICTRLLFLSAGVTRVV